MNGLKTETETIDGLEFTTTQFPAMTSLTLLARLMKTVGPAMSVLADADPKQDVKDLAPILAVALREVNPPDLTNLAGELFKNTSVILRGENGTRNVTLDSVATINLAFAGKLVTMFRALGFVLAVNYGDFFNGGSLSGAEPPDPTPAQ